MMHYAWTCAVGAGGTRGARILCEDDSDFQARLEAAIPTFSDFPSPGIEFSDVFPVR